MFHGARRKERDDRSRRRRHSRQRRRLPVGRASPTRGNCASRWSGCTSIDPLSTSSSMPLPVERRLCACRRRSAGVPMSGHWYRSVNVIGWRPTWRTRCNSEPTWIVGGEPRPDIGPYFFAPTILTGVREDMDLCRVETFGPVVSVYPVGSDAEAVARGQRLRVRLERRHCQPRHPGCPGHGAISAGGNGQHQRGVRGRVGQQASAHGRHGRVGAGQASRRRRPAEVHRVADHRDPAGARLRSTLRVVRRAMGVTPLPKRWPVMKNLGLK